MKPIYTEYNRYLLDEVISALQKDIRRANERNAMYWSLELIPKFESYLWQRLCVIVNEDIGIANPQLLLLVPQQRALYMEFREAGKDGSARLVLANVILLMCRSEKTRIADHFQCFVTQERVQTNFRPEIPDYALDKHTTRGRQLKRGVDHWLKIGCQLEYQADTHDPYAEMAYLFWESPNFKKVEWGKRKKKGRKDEEEDDQLPLEM